MRSSSHSNLTAATVKNLRGGSCSTHSSAALQTTLKPPLKSVQGRGPPGELAQEALALPHAQAHAIALGEPGGKGLSAQGRTGQTCLNLLQSRLHFFEL